VLDVLVPLLIAAALVCGALTGQLEAVGAAVTASARSAVDIAAGLFASMTLWLGLVRVLQAGGFLATLMRAVRPVMRRLFPEVPPDDPAMGFMVLNISANMMGLENAATPFGLQAMKALARLGPRAGAATDAMVLFVAINTANVTLFPSGIIALRAALGSTSAGSILLPTLLATLVSTAVAIAAAKLLAPLAPIEDGTAPMPTNEPAADSVSADPLLSGDADARPAGIFRRALALLVVGACTASLGIAFYARALAEPSGWRGALRIASSDWVLPVVVAAVVVWGLARGVAVFQHAVEGGREAFDTAVRVVPFLVVILVATGMLRASGAFDMLLHAIGPLAALLHVPAEALPMGLMRTLSGSGSRGLAAELMKQHGPDSFVGQVVSTIQGSTETTFYVLAVYFGAVRVRATRHALAACLIADAAGVFASVWACRLLL
jgi:spore maturation protein SpmA